MPDSTRLEFVIPADALTSDDCGVEEFEPQDSEISNLSDSYSMSISHAVGEYGWPSPSPANYVQMQTASGRVTSYRYYSWDEVERQQHRPQSFADQMRAAARDMQFEVSIWTKYFTREHYAGRKQYTITMRRKHTSENK